MAMRDVSGVRMKAGAVGASAALLGGPGSALLLALAASPAGAATTWTVDTLADGVPNASDCTTPVVGSCSLRDALAAAAVGDVVIFSAGLFAGGAGTITLSVGELVDNGVDVHGPGADVLTIDAMSASRIFEVTPAPGGTTISGVTLTNGDATEEILGGGGAISSGLGTLTVRESVLTGNIGGLAGGAVLASSLVLVDSVVVDNSASYFGGGVVATEELTVTGSTISGNSVVVVGGGLGFVGETGTATIVDSTVSGNSAAGGGGFFVNSRSGTVMIANSTFTGNVGIDSAGAIYADAVNVEISMSTITGNSTLGEAGSLYSVGGLLVGTEDVSPILTLTGTVVAGNTAGTGGVSDLGVVAVDGGAVTVTANDSLIGSGVSSNVSLVGDGLMRSDAPMVGPLADNGGPTLTMLPLAGSPLIDAGPATIPTFPANDFDQRGFGFPRVSGTRSDIGAVEGPAPITPITPVFTG